MAKLINICAHDFKEICKYEILKKCDRIKGWKQGQDTSNLWNF